MIFVSSTSSSLLLLSTSMFLLSTISLSLFLLSIILIFSPSSTIGLFSRSTSLFPLPMSKSFSWESFLVKAGSPSIFWFSRISLFPLSKLFLFSLISVLDPSFWVFPLTPTYPAATSSPTSSTVSSNWWFSLSLFFIVLKKSLIFPCTFLTLLFTSVFSVPSVFLLKFSGLGFSLSSNIESINSHTFSNAFQDVSSWTLVPWKTIDKSLNWWEYWTCYLFSMFLNQEIPLLKYYEILLLHWQKQIPWSLLLKFLK